MKKTLVIQLVILLSILPSLVFAQKNYHKGMIITNDYDTVFGLVKDRKPYPFPKLYKKIKFKKRRGSFAKKYGPNKIIGYSVGSSMFESRWIAQPEGFFGTKYESYEDYGEKQFLKVIVKGHLTYYQWEYTDPEYGHIYQSGFYKKTNEDYFMGVGQGIFSKGKRLKAYFQDCPALVYKLEHKEIRAPSEIADYYNRWYQIKNKLY